jgi:hypothetical protein
MSAKKKIRQIIRAILGPRVAQFMGDRLALHRMKGLSRQEKFSYIYDNHIWTFAGSDSGEGSIGRNTAPYVEFVRKLVLEKGYATIADVGCGDFEVGRRIMDNLSVNYIGVDIAPALIEKNTAAFARPNVRFVCLDIVEQEAPKADVYLIREVLQHLSNSDVMKALANLKRPLLVTEVLPKCWNMAPTFIANKDIPSGHMTRVERGSGLLITARPFSLKGEQVLDYTAETDDSKVLLTIFCDATV